MENISKHQAKLLQLNYTESRFLDFVNEFNNIIEEVINVAIERSNLSKSDQGLLDRFLFKYGVVTNTGKIIFQLSSLLEDYLNFVFEVESTLEEKTVTELKITPDGLRTIIKSIFNNSKYAVFLEGNSPKSHQISLENLEHEKITSTTIRYAIEALTKDLTKIKRGEYLYINKNSAHKSFNREAVTNWLQLTQMLIDKPIDRSVPNENDLIELALLKSTLNATLVDIKKRFDI